MLRLLHTHSLIPCIAQFVPGLLRTEQQNSRESKTEDRLPVIDGPSEATQIELLTCAGQLTTDRGLESHKYVGQIFGNLSHISGRSSMTENFQFSMNGNHPSQAL
jgi:hypothetical protein